jgi:hypothetical protein
MQQPERSTMISMGIQMPGGRAIAFTLSGQSTREACFALGLRRSGSSLFGSIASALAEANGVNVVDVAGAMSSQGYAYADWNGHARLSDLIWRGNLYVGFRDSPSALFGDPVFLSARRMLLVRDPRDALVSEFFAQDGLEAADDFDSAEGHSRRRQGTQEALLADYVLRHIETFNATIEGYAHLLRDPDVRVLRYEDVIFDKPGWIRAIAEHFGWQTDETLIANILDWADVRPSEENPRAFVRRVTPGDFRDKLSDTVISATNKRLSPLWRELGYELDH